MSFYIYLLTILYCILQKHWTTKGWKFKKKKANRNKNKNCSFLIEVLINLELPNKFLQKAAIARCFHLAFKNTREKQFNDLPWSSFWCLVSSLLGNPGL